MVIVQEGSAGSKGLVSLTASGNESQGILGADYETFHVGSDVPLKVRKPYTISKQREKWTEEEHQKFVTAIKLYGRAWRQIEEHIGTKTAVQIRSHAQKFFSKVAKEGSGCTEGSNELIEIPPPRPKRKPLHPYPRKIVETPKAKMCHSLPENGTSANLKSVERESHSPISVLAPEVSQISISHAKNVRSGSASAASPGSSLSQTAENSFNKDISNVQDENKTDVYLSLVLKVRGPVLDDQTSNKVAKELKDMTSVKYKDGYSESHIKFAPIKAIKLFGHTVVVSNPLEYSNSHLVSRDIRMGETKRSQEKAGINGIFNSGLNSNFVIKANNLEPNNLVGKRFIPFIRCALDREAASLMNNEDGRECQRVYS